MTHALRIELLPYGSTAYRATLDLRSRLLREPLGLQFDPAELQKEGKDWHIAAYRGEELVGCLVLSSLDEESVRMRQVAVEEAVQGTGVGRALVVFSEEVAGARGFRKMILHARELVVKFYEKLGYRTVGDPFIEVNIRHRTMEKSLDQFSNSSEGS